VDLAALADTEAGRPRRVPVAVTAAPAAPDGQVDEDGDADADPPVVRGNADRLSRAIGNVVDNAAHYATGTVCIAVGRRDDALRVTVDDDGPGVPPADRERIFERFTRLDHGRARPEGGTGLGLAVVRSIVAEHDGRVWADDSPLGGARIVIELPARQVPPGLRVPPGPGAGRQPPWPRRPPTRSAPRCGSTSSPSGRPPSDG
jgi:signal transduction histidine kinase